MSKLNLKWGLHKNLVKITESADTKGTIYVTTDTGAMYADVPDGESVVRKRISGSVMYFETLAAFAESVQPPYDTTMIYFIEKATGDNDAETQTNAMVRWVKDDTKPAKGYWTQINTPKDLYDALASRVSTLEGYRVTDAQDIADNAKAIEDLQELTKGHGEAIEDIKTALGISEGEGEGDQPNILERIEALEGTVGDDSKGLVKSVSTLEVDMDTAQEDITELEKVVGDESKGLVKDVNDLQGTVGDANDGLVKDVKDLQGTVGDSTKGLVKDVATLAGEIDTAQGDIVELEKVVGDANSGLVKDVDNLQDIVGDTTDGLVKDVKDLQDTVGDNSKGLVKDVAKILTDLQSVATQDDLKDAKEALEEKIDDDIRAVNAMRYKNTVASSAELPTTGVSIGDTYAASTTFTFKQNTFTYTVQPGDLLIATGTEIDSEYITSGLEWRIVETGYDADLLQKIEISSFTATDDFSSGAILDLQDYATNSVSEIEFKSSSKNLNIRTTGDNIIFDLQWDAF